MPKPLACYTTFRASYRLVAISLVMAPLFCRAANAPKAGCSSITNVDIQNGVVDWSGAKLVFKHGWACTSEGLLPGQDPACDCATGKCDWKMRVSEDQLLSPEPGRQLRLSIIEEDHLTGSGAWGRVLLYECRNHQLKKMMDQRYLYGVHFTPTRAGFNLESGYWLPTDARCCPSRRQQERFRWDSAKHKYTLSRRVVLKSHA